MSVRYRQHEENASRLAEFLVQHNEVTHVHFPGLKSHPGHALAARQQKSFGAMISFELDAPVEGVKAFIEGLQLFTLAESLGGVESLVAHPASMTHASMTDEDQLAAGINASLLRLSAGIEAVEDLVADLESGFASLQHWQRQNYRTRRVG